MVVAGEEEMRILLRGLLQLHRVRVDAEAEGLADALPLARERRPSLVVADSHLSDGAIPELIAGLRAILPQVRCVVVYPSSHPPPRGESPNGPDVLLRKPFRIREFAEAIAPSGSDRAPPRSA